LQDVLQSRAMIAMLREHRDTTVKQFFAGDVFSGGFHLEQDNTTSRLGNASLLL
jgi:hypothetical protein